MTGLSLEQAIEYLREGQKVFDFSNDFLSKPEVKSAALQAILDANGQEFSEALILSYNISLMEKIPDTADYRPSDSHLKNAQVTVFARALSVK